MIRWIALLGVSLVLGGCATPNPGTEIQPTAPGDESQMQKLARLHTQLAAGYYARNKQDVALEEINLALKVDPNYAPAHNVLGLVYMELKEDAKAEQSFNKAIALAPQDPEIRNNFGWYLCHKGKFPEAIAQFDLAARHPLYRTPDVALANAGQCSNRQGKTDAAERYYRQALALAPTNVAASYGLAEIAYRRGKFSEARELMKTVMRTTSPPAAALFIGGCLERKLEDRNSELSYLQQLRNRYPDSKELKDFQTGACP